MKFVAFLVLAASQACVLAGPVIATNDTAASAAQQDPTTPCQKGVQGVLLISKTLEPSITLMLTALNAKPKSPADIAASTYLNANLALFDVATDHEKTPLDRQAVLFTVFDGLVDDLRKVEPQQNYFVQTCLAYALQMQAASEYMFDACEFKKDAAMPSPSPSS